MRGPWLAMLLSLVVVLAIGWRSKQIAKRGGWLLLGLYPAFVVAVLVMT
jgi:hypothetical protein